LTVDETVDSVCLDLLYLRFHFFLNVK
jgi:hypothetical protein